MVRKPVKTTELEILGQRYPVEYFQQLTVRGGQRFSCEINLGGADRIILDDDSMVGLESKVERLGPATVYSRLLASRSPFAA
jgi:hypothetical protein